MSSGPQGCGTTAPLSISCCCEGRIMTVPSNLGGSQPKCLEIIKAFDLLIIIYCFYDKSFLVVSVQSPSRVRLFATLWTAARQASLSFAISQSSPKFMFIASVMSSNCLILWCLLLLPSIFPSIRDFSNESSVCIRWPKYWSFSFSIREGNGNPLQCSCLENPRDGGAWWAAVYEVAQSRTLLKWLSSSSSSFSISYSSEYLGLISLKIDWFDLFAVQGTFRSLL